MRKVIIILLIIIVAIVAGLYLSKGVFLAKFKNYFIEKIETATHKGVRIEGIDYIPTKGIRLSGVTVYADTGYAQTLCSISYLDMKFPVVKLLKDKVFSPKITLHSLLAENISVNGSFGFNLKLGGKIETVSFMGLSVKTAMLEVKDVTGSVDILPKSIKTSDIRFTLNKEPCQLRLEVLNPAGELSSNLELSSPNLKLTSSVKKEKDVYKITKIEGKFLESSFDFIGELEDIKTPVLSLYGKSEIDIKDIAFFMPEEHKKSMDILKPSGRVVSSIYFKGNLKDASGWEIGLKSDAEHIKVWNFKFDKFHMEMRLKDKALNIPLISAYPYNGVFVSSFRISFEDDLMPYEADCKLSNVDIAALLMGTELGNKNLRGLLFSEFAVEGNARALSSMRGSGRIFVNNANLGPMPLLTPLLGNLYGYLQHAFPDLKKIDITRGACDFTVANRKISTENLALLGEVIAIHARGYIDFDKNLNFEVENEFLKPEGTAEADWQTSIQEMMVTFGKFISKAYLTGTLDNPKWKFEYLGGMKNILKGGLDKVLKGIFSE